VPAAVGEAAPSGVGVVRKEHCCLLMDLPGVPAN
jgi:hypothetical protein